MWGVGWGSGVLPAAQCPEKSEFSGGGIPCQATFTGVTGTNPTLYRHRHHDCLPGRSFPCAADSHPTPHTDGNCEDREGRMKVDQTHLDTTNSQSHMTPGYQGTVRSVIAGQRAHSFFSHVNGDLAFRTGTFAIHPEPKRTPHIRPVRSRSPFNHKKLKKPGEEFP
jgi:hypothetical protein